MEKNTIYGSKVSVVDQAPFMDLKYQLWNRNNNYRLGATVKIQRSRVRMAKDLDTGSE